MTVNGPDQSMPIRDQAALDEDELAVQCARMFFLEDRSKVEIATALEMSRFKVARLIAHARDSGLVSITVSNPISVDDLADQLRAAFGLRDVVVVAETSGFAAAGQAGASLLTHHLGPGDLLGVGWGRSVDAVVTALSDVAAPVGVAVVQLAGGMIGPDPAFDPSGVASRAATVLGGTFTPLHAPAFLGAASTRISLLAEPSIAAAMDAYRRLTVALLGIGALGARPDSALVTGDALPATARQELTTLGAVSDVVCHFFDAAGSSVLQWEDRTVAIPLRDLLRTPLRIGVATGRTKADAVRAALHAKVINALVTDTTCARALLANVQAR